MAKRPQGLHKAAVARKKQKTEAPANEVSEEIESVENDEEIIQFDEDVDPNDEISSLYAIYKKHIADHKESMESDFKKDWEDELKYINLMINTCDNILRMNEKKKQDASNSKESEDTAAEKSKEKEPIDFIPLQLPNKVYHIYAFALISRGCILLDKESFLIRYHQEKKIDKERAIGFFELGLDMLENSTDLSGSVANTDGGEAFFLKSWGTGMLLQNNLVTKLKETARAYSTEMEPLINTAKDMFTKGMELVKKDQAITETCINAIELLQQLADNIYSAWNDADKETFNTGEVRLEGPNISTHNKFWERSNNLQDWTCMQYKELEKKAITNDDKAFTLAGIASYHLMRATPLIDQFERLAEHFEDTADERPVRALQNKGKMELEESIKLFEKAEKLYSDKAEKKRNILLVTIAEAKLSLRDLLNEVDYLPGESKETRESYDTLQEELKTDAVMRLKKAIRMSLGDFNEILEDLEDEEYDEDDNDDDGDDDDDDDNAE
ncbi:hypothetical protein D0Z00_002402 [Geotrichum galactomycetum]|uniref:Uncharacterized protein n=1 Tax=Geotrichum galactomycetum TaxID=27317 RepID=A0ACB6V484_9ASCO|nr:hypothetical protein D0Z00_002402 [Geotrichum candidum]